MTSPAPKGKGAVENDSVIATRRRSPSPDYGAINRTWANNPDDHPFYQPDDVYMKAQSCRLVPIEVPVFLYFAATYTTLPLTTFYLNERLYEEYGVPNATQSCTEHDNSSSLEDKIQTKLTDYNMYLSFLSTFPAVIPALFMGSASDRYGRKLSIYLVSFCTLLKNGIYALVFHYRWPVQYMYIANTLEGISGNYGTFLMGAYGIVADVTSASSERGFKITCVEAAVAIGMSAGVTATGYWITYAGYLPPILFAAGVQVFNMLFLLLAVPSSMPARDTSPLNCSAVFRSVEVFTKKTVARRRAILLLCLLVFFLGIFNLVANASVILLYLMHYPLCWGTTHITVYSGVSVLASWVLVLLAIGCLGHVVRDDVFALIGALSGVAGYTVQGLARTTNMIYIGGACNTLSNLLMPMLRAIMSKAVDATEQGSLFAGIGVVEMLGTTAAAVGGNAIYQVSLGVFNGLPWLCFAGLYALGALLLGVVVVIRNSDPKRKGFVAVEKLYPEPEEKIIGDTKNCQSASTER